MPEKITVEEKMVAAITITDHTALSYPCTKPEMMVVAGPPVRDLTIFFTGALCVPVKYSVTFSIRIASTTPVITASTGRHQPPGTSPAGSAGQAHPCSNSPLPQTSRWT